MSKNIYQSVRTWPFVEAHKLLEKAKIQPLITFETGYGPSGLPHIGTFGEVVRTCMVRDAFSRLSTTPTRLLCFSDDMDGLRKIPDNIPNPEKIAPFLNFPLTQVPDPFGQYASFGEHNNKRLCQFLDALGLEYTFKSSTEVYKSGFFNDHLLKVLQHHKEILDILLPTLREERRQSYSPFLPISPSSGRVLQVSILEYKETTIVFRDENDKMTEVPVTDGHCKLQWKVDWAMRWGALKVDYELHGKDLIDSVTVASKVTQVLGNTPPDGFTCEHFLDERGQKISKSKGNGLSMEEWLRYAPIESLAYFMYQSPRRAKRLDFSVIPKQMDEYIQHMNAYGDQETEKKIANPVWSVHGGNPPAFSLPLSYGLLLNLTSAANAPDKGKLWWFISRLFPSLSAKSHPFLDQLLDHMAHYYRDFIEPFKAYRKPNPNERRALAALADALETEKHEELAIQNTLYAIGHGHFDEMKDWFCCFYEVLLGQSSGPRVASFITLYGLKETVALIRQKLDSAIIDDQD